MSGFERLAQRMSQVSGVSAKDIRKTWENIKENYSLLNSCDRHDFSIDITPDKRVGKRWQCVHCKGELSTENKHWYELGIIHGKGKS